MSVFGAVTGRFLAFGSVTERLCRSLPQLLGDYVDLWLIFWEIMLTFDSVTVRLCQSLPQLLGDC